MDYIRNIFLKTNCFTPFLFIVQVIPTEFLKFLYLKNMKKVLYPTEICRFLLRSTRQINQQSTRWVWCDNNLFILKNMCILGVMSQFIFRLKSNFTYHNSSSFSFRNSTNAMIIKGSKAFRHFDINYTPLLRLSSRKSSNTFFYGSSNIMANSAFCKGLPPGILGFPVCLAPMITDCFDTRGVLFVKSQQILPLGS